MKGMNGTSELECTTTWKGVRYQRCLKTEYPPLSLPRMKVRRGFVLGCHLANVLPSTLVSVYDAEEYHRLFSRRSDGARRVWNVQRE
eukprot:scaffold1316_cov102-Alexandrium_tamarense.AAC.2